MVDVLEAKEYLKVETDDDFFLISQLIDTSEKLCRDILRQDIKDETVLNTAILYGVAYLYEHREDANHKELKETLYHLLLADRKDVF